MTHRKILGIDPSIACSGYALLEDEDVLDLGTIVTDAKYTETVRMDELYNSVKGLVLLHKPEIVVFEDQFMGPNPQTSLYLARGRGIAMMAAYHGGCNVILYTPSEIKKTITGKGNAGKADVQKGVVNLYGNSKIVQRVFANGVKTSGKAKNDDISDALGIAHTHKTLQAGKMI